VSICRQERQSVRQSLSETQLLENSDVFKATVPSFRNRKKESSSYKLVKTNNFRAAEQPNTENGEAHIIIRLSLARRFHVPS
jgi:hypothetical protein